MKGSGVGVEGRSSTVLIFEYVTGGGLAGQELPASWAAEGAAMRRAIAGDFASVPGMRVVMSLDSRLPIEALPGVNVRAIPDSEGASFESLAAEADYTVLIAPETDGILADLTRGIGRVGGSSLGSGHQAVSYVSDKANLAGHFADRGIPSPPTRTLGQGSFDWEGPTIIKPRWGAGAVDTWVVRERQCPSWVTRDDMFVAQPYLPGEPMSACFLIDAEGQATLLAIGRQRVEVDHEGRISYQGGTILSGFDRCPSAVLAAVNSVGAVVPRPGLRGFVGVDFLLDDRGQAVILEINPRPTTSFVGLARLWPSGTIAGSWLAASVGPLKGTEWPDRLRPARTARVVSFDADGTIHPEE